MLLTMENKNVSSAKSFGFEFKFSVRSFMYKRKNRGLRMDPWGIPALVSAHDEFWAFKTTLCFLLVKKSIERDNKSPEKPDRRNS